jgi:hypothetical protein
VLKVLCSCMGARYNLSVCPSVSLSVYKQDFFFVLLSFCAGGRTSPGWVHPVCLSTCFVWLPVYAFVHPHKEMEEPPAFMTAVRLLHLSVKSLPHRAKHAFSWHGCLDRLVLSVARPCVVTILSFCQLVICRWFLFALGASSTPRRHPRALPAAAAAAALAPAAAAAACQITCKP